MGWKFWKREDSEFEITSAEVPTSTIARWYLYDTDTENPNKVAVQIGLNPVSEEGDAAEREDSDARVKNVEAYIPFIDLMSDINAQVVVELQRKFLEHLPEEDQEFQAEIMRQMYAQISFAAIFGALSSGLSLGIISNPGVEFGKDNHE